MAAIGYLADQPSEEAGRMSVTIVDTERVRFKAQQGLDAAEIGDDVAFMALRRCDS